MPNVLVWQSMIKENPNNIEDFHQLIVGLDFSDVVMRPISQDQVDLELKKQSQSSIIQFKGKT